MSLTSALLEHEVAPGTERLRTSDVSSLTIVIFASGSRGDVQPYVALGLHLQEKGHRVFIATEERMRPLVEEFHLQYRRLGGDPTGFLFEPDGCVRLAKASMFELVKITEAWDKKYPKDQILSTYVTCAEDADVIISAALTMTASYSMAEKLNIPWIPIPLGATLPTSAFPLWALERIAVCSCLNKWTYNMAFKMLWQSESKYINPWREHILGLPPITVPRGIADILDIVQPPIIIASSIKTVGAKGEIPEDYPANVYVPGFFYVPPTPEENVDPALRSFLTDHRNDHRVIYLGFGSMPLGNPLHFATMALEVCNTMLCRAVIVAGWSKMLMEDAVCRELLANAINEKTIFLCSAAPHDYLFPRVDVIVHHCGVGTMAAALRAGKPQIPCPVMLDQPHNARMVTRLGCAFESIPFLQLSTANLSRALERIFCDDFGIFACAQRVKEEIEEECGDAMDEAYELIEDYVKLWRVGQSQSRSEGKEGALPTTTVSETRRLSESANPLAT